MAEGGSCSALPDPPSVDNIHLADSHILECPICLEQLRQPKSLPCRHSLCQECLCSYIVNEVSGTSNTATSFTCPVCRTLTHPVDRSEDKAKWAKQFPTDSVAIDMIQLRNRTPEAHYCMPCQTKGNMTTSAQFWCKITQSIFCESCKVDFHDRIHINCDVVDITGSNKFLLQQTTADKTCDKHKKNMVYYCEDHRSVGCSKCIIGGHRKCEDVTQIDDYCEKLKSSSRIEEMRTSLQQGADAMESLIQDFYLQLQSIADDKDTALKSIDDLHERIYVCIAEMKKEITDDLVTAYKEQSENLKVSSQKCERLKVAIQNTLESSATALQRNDHMDTILLYQRSQAEVASCKDLVGEMRKSLSTISIEHDTDPDMTSLGKGLRFGKIVVQKQSRQAIAGTRAFVKPLSECEMKELRKIHIKCPSDTSDCDARGVVYLTDGRIVVGDCNNKKIKLINTKGDVEDELKMNGSPLDLCMVDNTTVAVAIHSPGGIRIVTVAPSKLTLASEINTEKSCHGITYRDGGFVVSSVSEVFSAIKKDGRRGTTRNLHKYEGTDNMFSLAYDTKHGRLFTSHHTASTGRLAVGRLSSDNSQTDVLEVGVVKAAYGVDVDMDGNVYVCGHGSNNVVQMSGDGTNVRELLTAEDGIAKPEAISVCRDLLVLTNISPGQRNYITVFQLV